MSLTEKYINPNVSQLGANGASSLNPPIHILLRAQPLDHA